MSRPVLLDTGPLGLIAHPKARAEVTAWFRGLLEKKVKIIIPEISDYELRRNLLLENLTVSVDRLDRLNDALVYLPITTPQLRSAADLWASARRQGQATASDKALDGDVILAAQALEVGGVVATENVGHLARFCDARFWKEISPAVLS